MDLTALISANYDIQITEITLIEKHFGTEIYLAEAGGSRYIVKKLPSVAARLEKEEPLTRYLAQNGIRVAKLLTAKNGEGYVKTGETQFHIQEFIEGKTFKVNTAPAWLTDEFARLLGRIHNVLKNYEDMDVNFGKEFFAPSNAIGCMKHYEQRLIKVAASGATALISALEERVKHLKRISAFTIETEKLTYVNSHGDYHFGQLIVNNRDAAVVDWTGACKLPAALEVIMSYVFAAPECAEGTIDSGGLKRYMEQYETFFTLNSYDINVCRNCSISSKLCVIIRRLTAIFPKHIGAFSNSLIVLRIGCI
ncbi:MAG: aminoglycoside phosphotransferase family protein [Clostridiales bacterium]|jgi:Ser/Thr protein kinase RdoA (MazF antagonist)|nr:aminoglycoside phosphotransferase family protein [Clostridiales bacterium]